MAASVPGGSGEGRKGPPKRDPADQPSGNDSDDDYKKDKTQKPRAYCDVCNAYLRSGQTVQRHRRRSCVGPRDAHGDFRCLQRGCDARYRYYHDLQHHWRDKHPGLEQPAAMRKYIP